MNALLKTTTVLAALASLSLACKHGDAAAPDASAAAPARGAATAAPPLPAGHPGSMAAMCPMDVPGAKVAAADSPTGETVTFTTTSPDQVAELRQRVRAMSQMHEGRHAHGVEAQGSAAGAPPGGGPGAAMMPPPATTSVEDVDGGARVTVTPKDPADLQKLQAAVRGHADQMQQQGCAMMMHHGAGAR